MKFITLYFLKLVLLISISYNSYAENSDLKIVVLVNDEIITTHDVVQRMKLNAIIKGINITPENNKILANSVIDELINEKLKYEKIQEYKIILSDEEYQNYEDRFFKGRNFSKAELIEVFKTNKMSYSLFKEFLVNQYSWQKLIGGLYYRLTSASDIEINELIENNPSLDYENAKNIVIQKQLDLRSSKLFRDIMNEATIEYR